MVEKWRSVRQQRDSAGQAREDDPPPNAWRLSEDEWGVMRPHPQHGSHIPEKLPFFSLAGEIAPWQVNAAVWFGRIWNRRPE